MRKKSSLRKTEVFMEHDTTWKERRPKEIVWSRAKEFKATIRSKKSKLGNEKWIRKERQEIW